jgi:hypothetical protein
MVSWGHYMKLQGEMKDPSLVQMLHITRINPTKHKSSIRIQKGKNELGTKTPKKRAYILFMGVPLEQLVFSFTASTPRPGVSATL